MKSIANPSGQKKDKTNFDNAIDEFFSIYWGDSIYVKDKAAETAIIDFRLAIQDFQEGIIDENELKKRAHQLVVALKKSSDEIQAAELDIK